VKALRAIGVDIGGTKVLAALVTPDGEIEDRVERPTAVSSAEQLIMELDGAVETLRNGREVAALGFGIPSLIDRRNGRVLTSVNLPLSHIDFRDRMAKRHGLAVGIDNDANAAAIGEWRAGAARGADNVVMLTLGTGVGGGLILDGRPYRGATGAGAELGHVVVDVDGPLCPCGGRGHLEAVASGRAAGVVAQELYGPESDARDLVERAQAGEPEAVEALAKIGHYLGAAIGGFWNAFEPELVVVGGGFGAVGELVLAPAREAAAREALPELRDRLRIVPAELGADAGVVGAGMVAFEALA
jgi:glucokinase